MQKFDINRIIRKYFIGSLDESELQLLQNWLNEKAANQETFDALLQVWRERSTEPELVNTEEMIDKIWREGVEEPQLEPKRYKDWDYLYKIAAVILIFIATPLLEYKVLRNNPKNGHQTVMSMEVKENPAGQKIRINLPDGSIVWLNGASVIRYEPHFNDSVRFVELTGEAFFEVVKEAEKPFIVQSGRLRTIALGTSFNINAYPDEDIIQVSLLTGKVKIRGQDGQKKELILNPGHELVYRQTPNDFIERHFNVEDVTGWKEGKLIFKAADYHEVTDKLKIWFGVDVKTIGKPPQDLRLTTTYDNETLVNILKNIRFGKNFNYHLKENELIIEFN